jgi:beta-lactamase class A
MIFPPILLPIAVLAQLASTDSLGIRVRDRIAQTPGAVVGVAYWNLVRPDTLLIDADREFHAASTMKVPVMIEVFRQAEAGRLILDERRPLVNQFSSIVDGSPYSLGADADSDSSVYSRIGQPVTLRWLVERMIVRSSNLATNALIEIAGASRVQATVRALGAQQMLVRRGVEDGKAFERGLNNVTTARDMALMMAAIAEDRAASPASCRVMRDILFRQEFQDEIPAALPSGTRVANKTGSITAHLHDAAIVYPLNGDPYVLVVLTRGVTEEPVARALIRDVARLIHARAVP